MSQLGIVDTAPGLAALRRLVRELREGVQELDATLTVLQLAWLAAERRSPLARPPLLGSDGREAA